MNAKQRRKARRSPAGLRPSSSGCRVSGDPTNLRCACGAPATHWVLTPRRYRGVYCFPHWPSLWREEEDVPKTKSRIAVVAVITAAIVLLLLVGWWFL
jgi:hypothetical protein